MLDETNRRRITRRFIWNQGLDITNYKMRKGSYERSDSRWKRMHGCRARTASASSSRTAHGSGTAVFEYLPEIWM